MKRGCIKLLMQPLSFAVVLFFLSRENQYLQTLFQNQLGLKSRLISLISNVKQDRRFYHKTYTVYYADATPRGCVFKFIIHIV